jgi:hypothetical protein
MVTARREIATENLAGVANFAARASLGSLVVSKEWMSSVFCERAFPMSLTVEAISKNGVLKPTVVRPARFSSTASTAGILPVRPQSPTWAKLLTD